MLDTVGAVNAFDVCEYCIKQLTKNAAMFPSGTITQEALRY